MAATVSALKKELGANLTDIKTVGEDLFLTIKPESAAAAMKLLRDNKDCRFDYLSCLCGVDYPDAVTIVYHLFSTKNRQKATVKAPVLKSDARIASVTGLWIGADWHERETAEMFGITFEGHPDPRKLLLADDNDAHPLRKDFKLDYGDNG
jgi:NADH-quinone oxidoreductase subunit C